MAPLLDRVDHLLPAAYRDVVVRTPYRLPADAPGAAVLVGDAAHAMSPQLGTGTSLALADAWTLHHALATYPPSRPALAAYADARAAHVRWYQWWTRLMMPVFQSGLTPLAWPRDLLAPYVMKVPWVRRPGGHDPARRPHLAVVDAGRSRRHRDPAGGGWPRPPR